MSIRAEFNFVMVNLYAAHSLDSEDSNRISCDRADNKSIVINYFFLFP